MSADAALRATVVIVTKNRCDELRVAVTSAVAQNGPVDVLVIDDGSTDKTADMVRVEFPSVRILQHPESRGLVVRRNEGAREAAGDVLISIDDDAAFSTPRVVEQAVAAFDRREVGAVAIPYCDVNQGPAIHQLAPDATSVFITDKYIGTAHAVRKDLFLRLGGYREHLFHQGEEGDFCIRMLAAGWFVRLGSGDPIHHFESPKRDFQRMDHYGPRNAVLFAWQNVPFPYVLVYLPVTVMRVLLWTGQPTRFATRLAGVIEGFLACLRQERKPVPARAYRLLRWLRAESRPPTLTQVARNLGPPTP